MTSRVDPVGAIPAGDGRWRFRVWAPACERVDVHLHAPAERLVALEPAGRGYHEAVVDDVPPGATYRLRLDGGEELPDPASRFQPEGVHGPSALVDPGAYLWGDEGWRPLPLAESVFYELHVGTFTPQGTFEALAGRLHSLVDLGVTVVELMPVGQFPGGRNWGYDGVYPYAVQDSYGGPDGLRALVDAAHARGLSVCVDVVYNHVGPEGNRFPAFGPYFTDTYGTPWGRAVNVDGAGSDEVRAYFLGNALMWLEDYHVDALRLDATQQIHDETPRPFLAELTEAVDDLSVRLGRPFHLIAESDRNDPRTITPRDEGGLGFDATWNDDFHHAVHALLVGERDGYFVDYGSAEHVATALTEGFVYSGQYSTYRDRRHGAPATGLPGERFVVCVQNHDQVGNRARGERLSALVEPDRARLAAGLLLLSPFVPLLFMGEEHADPAPFRYFVSHSDPDLIEAVRRGRREEFSGMGWGDDLPDPQDEAAFVESRPDPSWAGRSPHREVRALYRELLALRRETPALAALSPGATTARVDGSVIELRRAHPSGDAWAAFNAGPDAAAVALPPGAWDVRLDSADERWGGPGAAGPAGDGERKVHGWSFVLCLERTGERTGEGTGERPPGAG